MSSKTRIECKVVFDESKPCKCGTGNYCHKHREYGINRPDYTPPTERQIHMDGHRCIDYSEND